jgi:hypothetical protein
METSSHTLRIMRKVQKSKEHLALYCLEIGNHGQAIRSLRTDSDVCSSNFVHRCNLPMCTYSFLYDRIFLLTFENKLQSLLYVI